MDAAPGRVPSSLGDGSHHVASRHRVSRRELARHGLERRDEPLAVVDRDERAVGDDAGEGDHAGGGGEHVARGGQVDSAVAWPVLVGGGDIGGDDAHGRGRPAPRLPRDDARAPRIDAVVVCRVRVRLPRGGEQEGGGHDRRRDQHDARTEGRGASVAGAHAVSLLRGSPARNGRRRLWTGNTGRAPL